MRSLIAVPLCLAVAACSGGGEEENKAQPAAAAETIEAGQWETSFEVVSHRSVDKTTPALKAAVGDKATSTTCVTEADKAKPDPALFAGEGYKCDYKSSYIRGGRLSASLACKRDGIRGDIIMGIQGSYTATGFEGTVDTSSYLPGDGDFAMSRKVTGRKTAPACQAAPAETKAG